MSDATYLKTLGARIRSELNDLKRTPQAAAAELGMNEQDIGDALNGKRDLAEMQQLIHRISGYYPIDASDLMIPESDAASNVRVMRSADSEASSRVFERPARSGDRTPYYEYRDTAMSRLSPINPEWIKELRVVDDADPNNPDVSYNNGHFLHQLTFFLGPVNFYYELDGRRMCVEMNTGDSNYIMPFFKHSFASRDATRTALIVAVTFGGDVRRAQKELCTLGARAHDYYLDGRAPGRRAQVNLIRQFMANERISVERLESMILARGLAMSLDDVFDDAGQLTHEQLAQLAGVLCVPVHDLMMPSYSAGEDVIVKRHGTEDGYWYPDDTGRRYRIKPLVRHPRMAHVKGFDIEVHAADPGAGDDFSCGLHTYIYNHGDSAVGLRSRVEGTLKDDILEPGDSAVLTPFVSHAFSRRSTTPGELLVVSVPGAMGIAAQREFAGFADAQRVIHETQQWFN